MVLSLYSRSVRSSPCRISVASVSASPVLSMWSKNVESLKFEAVGDDRVDERVAFVGLERQIAVEGRRSGHRAGPNVNVPLTSNAGVNVTPIGPATSPMSSRSSIDAQHALGDLPLSIEELLDLIHGELAVLLAGIGPVAGRGTQRKGTRRDGPGGEASAYRRQVPSVRATMVVLISRRQKYAVGGCAAGASGSWGGDGG